MLQSLFRMCGKRKNYSLKLIISNCRSACHTQKVKYGISSQEEIVYEDRLQRMRGKEGKPLYGNTYVYWTYRVIAFMLMKSREYSFSKAAVQLI